MQKTSKRRRIPAKERRTLALLREQIVQGRLARGTRLPKRDVLEKMFDVSSITLRRALDKLTAEGFIYATPGQGTFVAQNPPHLTHYGLVFPSQPAFKEQWGSFYEALNSEAIAIQQERGITLSIYYGMEDPMAQSARDGLIEDVVAHRIAGLIFASPPFHFEGTPLLDEPDMARVAFARFKSIPAIHLDFEPAIEKAMDYFASRGRRRVALISGAVSGSDLPAKFQAAVQLRGMETHSYWHQAVSLAVPEAGRSLVELMFRAGQADRPDALFIADDNLVPQATAGLLSSGVRMSEELDVVAHANFPWITPSMVPARRIGFHSRMLLEQAIALIDRQRAGEEGPFCVDIPASFEDELPLLVKGPRY